MMAGCNWCGSCGIKLSENKPYCVECVCNCKRECAVCHKPYPHLKYFQKHHKRCNSCQSRYKIAKNEKGFHRKFGDTISGQKHSYGSTDEESAGSSGEEKDDEEDDNEGDEEYDVEDNNDEGDRKEEATTKSKAVHPHLPQDK